MLKALVLASLSSGHVMFLYWLGGGNFERGNTLSTSALVASCCAIIVFAIVMSDETKEDEEKKS
jgi:hypothetical protein